MHAAASILQIFLLCRPFAAHWDPRVLGFCGDHVVAFVTLEVSGLLLDIAILSLPVRPLWKAGGPNVVRKLASIFILDHSVVYVM